VNTAQPDRELVHVICPSMRKILSDEIAAESVLSSLAYGNLAIFVAVLFCFSGLDPTAAISYVVFTFVILLTTAFVGYVCRQNTEIQFCYVAVLSIVFVNELALVSILAFDITADNRADSVLGVAIIVSASFISVHLCARHTVPMLLSKVSVITACSVFLIFCSTQKVSNSEVLASLMVALLIMLSIGYWILFRRRQEIHLQVQLQKMNDLSDRQNAELVDALKEKDYSQQRLQDESELRQKLISHIGHDLRQPISAAGYMLMEMGKQEHNQKQALLIDDTRECVQSAGRMIENIVQFTHYDNLEIDVRPEIISLNEILQSICREYSVSACQAHCRMRCVETSITVLLDPDLLKRIIRNLTINVINHSDATKLLLGVRRTVAGIEVWVADNGCGLQSSDNTRDSARERQSQTGLGLGMKISKQLAEACGAQLKFHSRQGEGTVCKLAIPHLLIVTPDNTTELADKNKDIALS